MGFGLFKKKKTADVIYFGGKIYTLDEEYPEAEAVAVKDGIIIAVGEKEAIIDDLRGDGTVEYNLEGKYMLPGLIKLNADITPEYLKNMAKEMQAAAEAERKALEEAGVDPDEEPEDEEENPEEAEQEIDSFEQDLLAAAPELEKNSKELTESGFTTVLNIEHNGQADDIFKNMLMARWEQNVLKQRYYGSVNISRMVDVNFAVYYLEQKRTVCNELEGFINANHVTLSFSIDTHSENFMSQEYLDELTNALGERGYGICLSAKDEATAAFADELCENLKDTFHRVNFYVNKDCGNLSPEDMIHEYTLGASAKIGELKRLGSIEDGKIADFAIFETDPYSGLGRAETIIAGKETKLMEYVPETEEEE